MIDFSCDYNCGCAPEILAALAAANESQHATYGLDVISARAKEKIRAAVGNPDADVYFLVGGTQTNATVLSAILRPWEGVVSAASGHIAVHESGAVEATGHKVLTVAADEYGRIEPETLRDYLRGFYADETCPHMVQPGAVYLSHPTEYGGLYSAAALREIRAICDEYALRLFVDGARLAYGLASKDTDLTLADIARLCDAFYIGGTKCGALFGEAVVFPKKNTCPHFFTTIKQRGALLAKGWLLGIQFDALFTENLYLRLGENALEKARRLRKIFLSHGYTLYTDSPTNQQFFILTNAQHRALSEKMSYVQFGRIDKERIIARFVTSWATTDAQLDALESTL